MGRTSRTTIDSLIAESKQITADLMTLRREVERHPKEALDRYSSARTRAGLIVDAADRMTHQLRDFWYGTDIKETEDAPARMRRAVLHNGTLRLTSGGR
jgi:hypothetical protein